MPRRCATRPRSSCPGDDRGQDLPLLQGQQPGLCLLLPGATSRSCCAPPRPARRPSWSRRAMASPSPSTAYKLAGTPKSITSPSRARASSAARPDAALSRFKTGRRSDPPAVFIRRRLHPRARSCTMRRANGPRGRDMATIAIYSLKGGCREDDIGGQPRLVRGDALGAAHPALGPRSQAGEQLSAVEPQGEGTGPGRLLEGRGADRSGPPYELPATRPDRRRRLAARARSLFHELDKKKAPAKAADRPAQAL